MIKAVIFDFDGVIGDTMQDNYLAWQKAFLTYNFQLNSTEYYQLEGMGRFQIAQHFIDKYNLNKNIINDLVESKERIYKEQNTFKIYDYVEDIFKYLNSKKLKIAIVTGASKDRIISFLPNTLSTLVDALITADDVVNTKPHPEPYLKAIKKLNLTADHCLVIENAILGIKSAKSANCKCFALETTLTKKYLTEADEIFGSHKDLFNKFKLIF